MYLHGVAVKAMVDHLERVGRDIPPHYLPPELLPGASDWLDAFNELSTDRLVTQYGSMPIPAASIDRHVFGWEEWEAFAFRRCIRAMDVAYLEAIAPPKDGEEKGGLPQPAEN